jgi:hypothetical protein
MDRGDLPKENHTSEALPLNLSYALVQMRLHLLSKMKPS